MTIELSTITFTEQADIVPLSGMDEITNGGYPYEGRIVNTLAGDDIITGTWTGQSTDSGIRNNGTLNTGEGHDVITGITPIDRVHHQGILNMGRYLVPDISSEDNPVDGIIDTGDGNDTIIGIGGGTGINFQSGTINTGKGNDIITAMGYSGLTTFTKSFLNTGEGDDVITAISLNNIFNGGSAIYTGGSLDTGSGNDIISGTGTNNNSGVGLGGDSNTGDGNDTITGSGRYSGFSNGGIFNAGNGEDSIISHGRLQNSGQLFLGDGNDSIIVDTIIEIAEHVSNYAIYNFNSRFIGTGDGNDTITSTGVIYNEGVIETGNGDDSIIVNRRVNGINEGYSIYNKGGTINMGNGNDSIIANDGFESGSGYYGSSVVLGNGEDYLKGFGSGEFSGENGNDTLELTPGTYTIGRWYTAVTFTKGDQLMITSDFEKLIAGSTTYDFTSLTKGQTITVA